MTEVSTIANDSYMFYLDLNKKTRDDIAKIQETIKTQKQNIVDLENQIIQNKEELQNSERGLALLKQKELDLQGVIGELEKNKAQFKNIVTGAKR